VAPNNCRTIKKHLAKQDASKEILQDMNSICVLRVSDRPLLWNFVARKQKAEARSASNAGAAPRLSYSDGLKPKEAFMKLRLLSTVAVAAFGAVSAVSIATAQEHPGMILADNEALYVDGPSFGVIIGRGKGDTAAELRVLHAYEIGPGAIIIRSGDKLYLAAAEDQTVHAYEPTLRNYAYDPATDHPAAAGGGSAGYNENARRNYAYDPALDHPAAAGGGSAGYNENARRNYAYDPALDHPAAAGGGSAGYNENARRNYAYDPATDHPAAAGGGSAGYNENARRNYAYDPALDHPAAAGGGSAGYNENARRNYAYDPALDHPAAAGGGSAGYNENARRNYAYDPEYAQYRLKKEFESHWTPIVPKP
jgi:hypothetical protein